MQRSRSPRLRQPVITPTRAATAGIMPKGGTKVCPNQTQSEVWTQQINIILKQQQGITESSQKLQNSLSRRDEGKDSMHKRQFEHDRRIRALETKVLRRARITSSAPAVIPPPPGPSPYLDNMPVRPGPPPPLNCADDITWFQWYKAEKSWTERQSWYAAGGAVRGYCRLCKNETGGAVPINLLHLIQPPHRINVENFFPGQELHEVLL